MKELVIKDDIFDAIDRTDWYHIEGGELVYGAKEDDGALYNAPDIYAAVNDVKPVGVVILKSFDCMDFVEELRDYIATDDDDYIPAEVICRKLHKYGLIDRRAGRWIL